VDVVAIAQPFSFGTDQGWAQSAAGEMNRAPERHMLLDLAEMVALVLAQAAHQAGQDFLAGGGRGQAEQLGPERVERIARAHQVGGIGHAGVAVEPGVESTRDEIVVELLLGCEGQPSQ
jgi:hypothetical protein